MPATIGARCTVHVVVRVTARITGQAQLGVCPPSGSRCPDAPTRLRPAGAMVYDPGLRAFAPRRGPDRPGLDARSGADRLCTAGRERPGNAGRVSEAPGRVRAQCETPPGDGWDVESSSAMEPRARDSG